MTQWLNQHMQALRLVLSRLRRNFGSTFIIWAVIGVTLSLPGALYVVVDNLNQLTGQVRSEPQLSLFLKLDASPETVTALGDKLKHHPDIKSYRFVGKDAAWQQLQLTTSTAGVASNLEKNPLPDAYFIQPKALEPEAVAKLQQELQQWDGVELAQADANWVKRLFALLELGKKAILVISALLGLALVAIIGNTIRLQIVTQRDEIEVSQLIGATDRFIRRPFLYAGALYGLGGGLAAWGLLAGVVSLFNASVAEIAALYSSDFTLALPGFAVIGAIVGIAVALGWLGSLFAVNRSLAKLKQK